MLSTYFFALYYNASMNSYNSSLDSHALHGFEAMVDAFLFTLLHYDCIFLSDLTSENCS